MMFIFATQAAAQDVFNDEDLSLLQLRANHNDYSYSSYSDAGENGITQWASQDGYERYADLSTCSVFTPGKLCGAGNVQTTVHCGTSFSTIANCGPDASSCGASESLPWQAHAEQCIKQCESMFPDGVVHCSKGDADAQLPIPAWDEEGRSQSETGCPAGGIIYDLPIVGYDVDWPAPYHSADLPVEGKVHCWAKLANPKYPKAGVQRSQGDQSGDWKTHQTCLVDPLKEDDAAAVGDPHMSAASGETSDLCCEHGICKPCDE